MRRWFFLGVKEPNEIHETRENKANKQQEEGKQEPKQNAEEQQKTQESKGTVGNAAGCDDDAMMMKPLGNESTDTCVNHPGHLGDLGHGDPTAKVRCHGSSSSSSSTRTGATGGDPPKWDSKGSTLRGNFMKQHDMKAQQGLQESERGEAQDREKGIACHMAGTLARNSQERPQTLRAAVLGENNDLCCADGCSGSSETLASATWRDRSQGMEQDAAPAEGDRAGRPRRLDTKEGRNQPPSADGGRDQQGCPEESLLGEPHQRAVACEPDRQRDHRSPQGESTGCGLPYMCGPPTGLGGVRPPLQQEVPRSVRPGAGVLSVGTDNGHRRADMPKTPALCSMVGSARPSRQSQGDDGQPEGLSTHVEGQELQGDQRREHGSQSSTGPADCSGGNVGERGAEPEGGEGIPSEDQQFRGRGFFERLGSDDEPTVMVARGEVPMSQAWDLETREKPLDVQLARQFDFKAERLVPDAFQSLVTHGRAALFEVACGPDSLLTAKMRQLTGRESSAERLSFWNGYDMTTSLGVRAVISRIEKEKPCHVWLSLECGPFSKMQNVNQRTEKQREELKQKRNNCIRQYIGGLLVYIHCCQHGVPVTWEWSETSDAWRLPMVQRVFEKYPPKFCVVKGCRVNLRDLKTRIPLQKGWKLATTHDLLSQNMSLPCTCREPHAPCQGRMTRESAYYTDDFARRVCKTILEDIRSQDLRAEVTGHTGVPKGFLGQTKGCSCDVVRHPRSDLRCNLCEMGHEKGEPLSLVGINRGNNHEGPLTLEERDKALKDIATIHRNTGHGPLEHLVRALEARKTDPRIVQLAREYQCDVCRECSRRVPRPQVSLEPLPPKWKVLQADNAHLIHPHSGERVQFTLLIDEGCRFRIGKIMSVGTGSGVKAKDLVSFFQEQWKPVFGKPDKVRLDPAGSWRSNEVSEYFESIHVEVDVIPAEAHWNTSHVERAIQATKHVMYRLAAEDPQITAAEALSEAIRVENEREVVRGYSPAQHALGRAPDAAGRFFESEHLEIPPVLCENGNGEYRRNVERMRNAEQAFSEWVANERIKRAKNTRTYQVTSYAPGDLVYVWRVQTKGPGSAGRTGGFTGPARVLALETRLTAEGNYRPGSVVWLVRGSRLIKAVPEILRRASIREECMEELVNPPNLPWTFTKLADDIGVRQYDDVTDEVPNVMEYEQGVDEETMRPFKRIRSKRTAPECPPPAGAASSSGGVGHATLAMERQHTWEDMPDSFQDEYAQSFWTQETAAVEVEIGMPETKRGWKHCCDHFEIVFDISNPEKGH